MAYLAQVLFARLMGASEYGLFSFVMSWVLFAGIVSRLGLPTVILRLVPEYDVTGRRADLHGLFLRSHQGPMVIGAVLSLMLIVGVVAWRTLSLPGFSDGGSVHVLFRDRPLGVVLGLVLVPLIAVLAVQQATVQAMNRVVLAMVVPQLLRHVLVVIGALLVLRMFGRVSAVGLLGTVCAVVMVLTSVQFGWLRTRLGGGLAVPPRFDHARAWLRAALVLTGAELAITFIGNIDVAVLGFFTEPAEVGLYSAAARTAILCSVAMNGVSAAGAPMLSRAFAAKDMPAVYDTVRRILRWSVGPSLLVWLALVGWGDRVLAAFGPGFVGAYPVLVVLASGQLVNAMTGPVSYLLNLSGNEVVAATAYGVCAAISVGLMLAVVPTFGAMGAAGVASGTMVGCNLWLAVVVKQRLGVDATVLALRRSAV